VTTISIWRRDAFEGADARAHPAQDALVLQITIDVAKDDALLDLMAQAGCRWR